MLLKAFIHQKRWPGYPRFVSLWIMSILCVSAAASGDRVFDVTDYGADGSDEAEDVAAIEAAIEAAAGAGGGVVYIPEGTYYVSPPGTAQVSLYEKVSGSWQLALESAANGTAARGWRFSTEAAETVNGEAGERLLGLEDGIIYERDGSAWAAKAKLVDGAGSGWYSGYETPGAEVGANGDVYLQFHVKFDHSNGAVFQLEQRHSNITFRGDGIGKSILSFRTWSGGDPMDYEVDVETETIIRTSIARNSGGRYSRGSLFVMLPTKSISIFENIHWEGLDMRGNTIANGKHAWYSPYDDLEEWDISNKAIVFTFGGRDLRNISVRNCALSGWRGEILYKGGKDDYAEILIENCDIFETNSSAVSISGNMVMQDCRIWNAYNGVENYCDEGQFSEIRRVEFNLGKGDWGVVYLGTEASYLIVEDCDIRNTRRGGVFLSDFASNVTIRNNTIADTMFGVYFLYLNQYGLPGRYNNILIEENTFRAETRSMESVVHSFIDGWYAKDWVIRNNLAEGRNGFSIKNFLFDNHRGPREERHNVIVQGNIVEADSRISGNGLSPVFENNNFSGSIRESRLNKWFPDQRQFLLRPDNEVYVVGTWYGKDVTLEVEDSWRFPPGHRFEIDRNDKAASAIGIEIRPAAWNNLDRGYFLFDDAVIAFEMGEGGEFQLAGFEPPDHAAEVVIRTGSEISARGRESVNLEPIKPTVFDSFSGIAVNVPVTLHVNDNVQFANNDFIRTPTEKLYVPPPGVDRLQVVKDQEDRLNFIDGVFLREYSGNVVIRQGEVAELFVSVDSAQPVLFHWFAGKQGDQRSPLGETDSGILRLDGFENTGTHYYWARIYSGAGFVDSPTLMITVIPDPETWEWIGRFAEEDLEAWSFVGSFGDLLDPPSDSQLELVSNIWIGNDDTVLALHNKGNPAHVQRTLAWGPSTYGGSLFLRLYATEEAPTTTFSYFKDAERAFIDVPVFTMEFKVENGSGFLKFPGGVRIEALKTHQWTELKLTFDFETGNYSVGFGPAMGVDPGSRSEGIRTVSGRSSRLRGIDGIRRVAISSRTSSTGSPPDTLFIDDFLFKRSPYGPMEFSPVLYSYWQDLPLEDDGSRITGLGRVYDNHFPWIFFPSSGKWLYVYPEISTRNQIWGVVFDNSQGSSLVFSGDQFAGWYLVTSSERSAWRKF
jgi:hypothetical protein